MRILAIHRYFWPDTPPYASMLRAIASRWAADGHDVEVFSTQPSYKAGVHHEPQPSVQALDRFKVRRVRLLREAGRSSVTRVFNLLAFCAAILANAILRRRYDLIMISTAPPVLPASAARWAARLTGARFVYHCMDVHPEIGRISGEFSHPLVFSWLRWIDSHNCRGAARVIVLSGDMEHSLRTRPAAAGAKFTVINNFSLPEFGDSDRQAMPQAMAKSPGRFRILFAGNVGRFQGLESVVEAVRQVRQRDRLEMVFLGEGKALPALKTSAANIDENLIRFFPHQPVGVARQVVQSADLCLVTLRPEIYRYAYPSKTMSYLAEGRPLLVVVEPESELARLVLGRDIGIVVPPGDPRAIADAVSDLVDSPERHRQMATNAKATWREIFDQEVVLDRWSALVEELAGEAGA